MPYILCWHTFFRPTQNLSEINFKNIPKSTYPSDFCEGWKKNLPTQNIVHLIELVELYQISLSFKSIKIYQKAYEKKWSEN